MFIPNLAFYPRDAVSEAVSYIAMHQPARRAEVVKWFDEVFHYFIDHCDDNGIIETDLIGSMVIYCTRIKALELTETIKTMFEHDLVSVDFCGPFEDVEEELSGTINDDDIEPFLTIFDQYDYFRSATDDDEGPDVPDYQFPEKTFEKSSRSPYYKPQMPAIAAKTPGRNDPCSCGSGKKYKKCCM